MRDEHRDLRVAIVGAGPRGLSALERLTRHAARRGAPLTVDVYDPTPTPGAGPVYAPGQPDYLRMNFPAGQIDAWWPDDGAVPTALRRSFVDWCAQCSGATDETDAPGLGNDVRPDSYVPRALVGRYLHDAFLLVSRFKPPNVRLGVVSAWVRSVAPDGDRWRVDTDDESRTYDEILFTGGHRAADRRALAREWSHAAPLVRAVFPVERWLTAERVPPGSTVALRGFALTAIDAILALTEGRGGRFVQACTTSGLWYEPEHQPPVTIHPYSRTGRPMRPKPEAAVFAPIARQTTEDVAAATERIPTHPDGVAAVEELVRTVASVAASVLDVAGGSERERGRLDRWTAALAARSPVPIDRTPREELVHGYAVATGKVPLDAEAALGIAWRLVYPTVVDRFSGAPLGEDGWTAFRSLAAELERVGFGPCTENVAKLLALVDAGYLVLDHAAGGRLSDRTGTTELRSDAGAVVVDRVIDGVLPAAGVERDGDTPLERLLAAGQVTVAPGQRGIRIDPHDATALDGAGRPIRGLAAIGRHTEDATIGNDTLNRTLHPQVDRWAERVVARATGAGEPPTDVARNAGSPPRRCDPARAPAGGLATLEAAVREDAER